VSRGELRPVYHKTGGHHPIGFKPDLAMLKRMAVMRRRLKRGEPLKDNRDPLPRECFLSRPIVTRDPKGPWLRVLLELKRRVARFSNHD